MSLKYWWVEAARGIEGRGDEGMGKGEDEDKKNTENEDENGNDFSKGYNSDVNVPWHQC